MDTSTSKIQISAFLRFNLAWFATKTNNTSGSRGGAARAPPNGREPMIFFYAQNAIFSQFFLRSLRSR